MKIIISKHFKSEFFSLSMIGTIVTGVLGMGALGIYFVCRNFCKTYHPSGDKYEFHPIQYDIYINEGNTLLFVGIGSLLVALFMILINIKAVRDLNKKRDN
jgi:hypothetical protein